MNKPNAVPHIGFTIMSGRDEPGEDLRSDMVIEFNQEGFEMIKELVARLDSGATKQATADEFAYSKGPQGILRKFKLTLELK